MRYKTLTLIGTSHISKDSVELVKDTIEKEKPAVIAIELDRARLAAMLSKKKARIRISDIRRIGFKGFIFAAIGAWAEKRLGRIVGVAPGSEMMAAIRLAHKNRVPLALIDQDIEITLKRFSNSLSWREKWRFVADLLSAIIFRKGFEFDIRKVPSQKVINKLTKHVAKRYPNIYRVLVTERNRVMAKNIASLMRRFKGKRIVAVVGAGHEKEMLNLVKRYLKRAGSKNKK